MRGGRWVGITLLGLFLGAAGARAESYYVIVFGSQRPFNRPSHTHSFAAFVRYAGPEDGCPGGRLEAFAISWMPQTLDIDIFRLRPEPGVNLELHTTLRWAWQDGQRISMWGPYQIRKELYDRALAQAGRLRSGAVRYKAVDTGFPTAHVSNCIHALSDLVLEAPRLRIGTPGWGESASYFIALSFGPWLIDRRQTHDWLLGSLGLTGYPLVRRDLEHNPTHNPVLHALQSTARWSLKCRLPD